MSFVLRKNMVLTSKDGDLLGLKKKGHMNTPGTVGSPNWEWRMPEFQKIEKELKKYKSMIVNR